MERISSKLFLNSHAELSKTTPHNDPTCDFASNHDLCEMTTDGALKNISSMLFEENIDEINDVYPEEAALQAVEKSFYDILRQNHPSSPSNQPQPNWTQGYATSTIPVSDSNHEICFPIVEFNKGLEEGMKFLPCIGKNKMAFDLQANELSFPSKSKKESNLVGRNLKLGKEEDRDCMIITGKRHTNCGDLPLGEGWKCKIPMLYFNNRDETFDKVLLMHEELHAKEAIHLREIMKSEMRLRDKKEIHVNLVDLRVLLIHCAQAISINDTQCAHQLIKQIRKHSSPDGNGDQRMAHIFVNGLEARLNGVGNKLYRQLTALVPQETATGHFNAFHMSLISNPFLFALQYYANHTILNAIGKASKLHIIHLGIEFGFHWPCLIHALSKRMGGPPKLRITGIDNLKQGYLPIARLEVAGKRLEGYTRIFDIPFEYKGIGSKWDEICIEDLNIEKDEVLIVNCLQGLEALGDETDAMYTSKDRVLDIIRLIKPNVFIQGIMNGSHSSSFFADRFKQTLLHHSAMFNLLDNTIPRGNNEQRWYLENYVLGRGAVNVIACEGLDRFIRPKTYKQWHARNLRAGYNQLPLDHTIIKRIKDKVREIYNRDFLIEDDNEWLLLGWKGRVMVGLSTWRPRQI